MRLIKLLMYGLFTLLLNLVLLIQYVFPIPLDSLNSDLGRHLLLGEIIFTSGSIPNVNLFSYTFTDYPFINTHWLSEVIFYLWHRAFGFNGLIILSVLLIVSAFSVIFYYSAKKIDAFTTILISLILIQVMAGRVQVRPELFSFLFLSVFITVLYRYREKSTRWIYVLIPLQLLWVNTHIYFFTGIVVLLLFLVDAYISKKDAIKSKKFLTLLIVTGLAGLAMLCNPNFIRGATYPLFVLSEYGMPIKENIDFFTATQLSQKPTLIYFVISFFMLWINMLFAYKKMKPVDYLLSGFFTFMAFFAIRNFPLFAIGAFIPMVTATTYVLHLLIRKFDKKYILLINISLFILVLVAIIPSIQWNIKTHKFGFGVTDNSREAVDFLIKNNIKGKIYNNFDSGNYLEYRLYTNAKVYVDARPEAYPKDFFQKTYLPALTNPAIFNQEDKKYNFNIIYLDHTDAGLVTRKFLNWLSNNDEWKMVYLNSVVVIFLKDNSSNQEVIKQYSINEKNVSIRASDYNDKEKIGRLTNFFSKVGWQDQLLKSALRYLDFEFDPVECPVLGYAAKTLQKQNNPKAPVYVRKYINYCK